MTTINVWCQIGQNTYHQDQNVAFEWMEIPGQLSLANFIDSKTHSLNSLLLQSAFQLTKTKQKGSIKTQEYHIKQRVVFLLIFQFNLIKESKK